MPDISPHFLQNALTAVVAGLLLVAAFRDMLLRLIPNPVSIGIATAGLLLRLLGGNAGLALLAAGGVFLLSFLLWRRGLLGGGDVKLLSALTLAVPPPDVLGLLFDVAVIGAALGLAFLMAGRLGPIQPFPRPTTLLGRAWRTERRRLRRGGPLPYAVAIALGGILSLAQGA